MRWIAVWLLGAAPLAAQDVVILGEVHDNPAHHVHQAGELLARPPAAVVFEMLTPDQAQAAEATGRTPDAIAEATGWAQSGWPDFALYAPVFAAMGEARIFGGALPRGEVRRAVTEGAAAVLGDERFPLGPLPEAELAERVAEQQEAHCNALPEDLLPGMVEAQRLRDAALARAVIAAHEATGGPVAVITGNGHARRDRGIPRMLAAAAPGLTIEVLGQFEAMPEDGAPYDRWVVFPAPDREDPCAVFQTGKGG